MTVIDALKTINGYPVPEAVLQRICLGRGLAASDELTAETMESAEFELACADVMDYLSSAPSVTQGGISFNLPVDAQKRFSTQAASIYAKHGVSASGTMIYGYKGSSL